MGNYFKLSIKRILPREKRKVHHIGYYVEKPTDIYKNQ